MRRSLVAISASCQTRLCRRLPAPSSHVHLRSSAQIHVGRAHATCRTTWHPIFVADSRGTCQSTTFGADSGLIGYPN
jgi:hypothetical protein